MSVDSGHTGRGAKLPVVATIRGAYATVFGRLGDLVALAAIPFVISMAGQILILFVPAGLFCALIEKAGLGGYVGLTYLIGFLTTFVPWAVFVVSWHRFALLGKRDTSRPVEFYFATRGVKYYFGTRDGNIFGNEFFVCMFLPGFLLISLYAVFSYSYNSLYFHIPNIRTEVVAIFIVAFVINLGPFLSLPAHAIGHETSVYGAWRRIRGVTWRFFWIMFLVAIPFLYLFLQLETPDPVEMASYDAEGRRSAIFAYILVTIAEGLVLFVGTALFVAALCLSYQRVIAQNAQRAKPEEAATFSDWMVHTVLPVVLAVILGLAVYAIAGAMGLPNKGQFLLAAAAGLGLLGWKIHRLQPRNPGPD